MCFPVCRGGAYFSASVFIYRSLLLIISMVSSSFTRLKSTYLPISLMEELLLQLIFFIPLFTSSTFIFIGLQSYSFTFVLNATVSLSLTLFVRYALELGYIRLVGWTALSRKIPALSLSIVLDICLVIILFLYARNRLRKKKSPSQMNDKLDDPETNGDLSHTTNSALQRYEIPPKAGEGPLRYSHSRRSFSPGPFVLPPDELDDLSIPSYAPISPLRTSKL